MKKNYLRLMFNESVEQYLGDKNKNQDPKLPLDISPSAYRMHISISEHLNSPAGSGALETPGTGLLGDCIVHRVGRNGLVFFLEVKGKPDEVNRPQEKEVNYTIKVKIN